MNGNNNRHHMTSELSTASPTEVVTPQQRPGPQQPVVKGIMIKIYYMLLTLIIYR